jgi:ribonucleoside-triphosphate reductase (thioredoxin)
LTVNDLYFPHETGRLVYERTYSRPKPDGTREIWPETVERVVDGNLALVDSRYIRDGERDRLIELATKFKILPAGRHLWASGVKGRQYLFNCHVAGWGEKITDHFAFAFMRLMEGGGVGANYSNKYLSKYPGICDSYSVHIVCDPTHPDYEKMKAAGVLSEEYDSAWLGSFDVEDSREGWAAALVDLMSTFYRRAENQARVFDVSRVRPEGARLKTFGGRASGPLPLAVMLHEVRDILSREWEINGSLTGMGAMEIDHAIATCVVSGGNRRSARMSIMRWDDWQIEDFLACKKDTGSDGGRRHSTTNISVEIDQRFFDLLDRVHGPGDVECDELGAILVLRKVAEGMLSNGEPGFWNSALSNEGEPNEVISTNPCGEIALEAWENCNLGHVNLSAFVREAPELRYKDVMRPWRVELDYEGLYEAHELVTRFLIRATYGDANDPEQAEILKRNRRIGVGHFGFASMLAKLGIRYSDAPDSRTPELLVSLAEHVDKAAFDYAHQLRIPVPVKTRTVAPTGTIAKMPGVSEGIHPIFAKYFIRRMRFSTIDPDQVDKVFELGEKGYRVEPCQYSPNTVVVEIPTKDPLVEEVERLWGAEKADEIIQTPADLNLAQMLAVQEMYQEYWADNAVSYTANVKPDEYTVSEVATLLGSFMPTLKGATVFPEASMVQAPYERITRDKFFQFTNTAIEDSVDEDCMSGACPVR